MSKTTTAKTGAERVAAGEFDADAADYAMRLGDTVEGFYGDVAIRGTLTMVDSTGWLYVSPEGSLVISGTERDTLAFDPRHPMTRTLRTVARAIDAAVDYCESTGTVYVRA